MTTIGFKLDTAKGLFFDSRSVTDPAERAQVSAVTRAAGFARLTARRSIRRRKKVSAPDTAPTNRTGLLKENIFYFVDRRSRSAIIGPIRLNGTTGAVPKLLEEGGTVFVRDKLIPVKRAPRRGAASRFDGKDFQRFTGALTYKARPYMGPAKEKAQERLLGFLKDSIR